MTVRSRHFGSKVLGYLGFGLAMLIIALKICWSLFRSPSSTLFSAMMRVAIAVLFLLMMLALLWTYGIHPPPVGMPAL